MVAVNKSLVIGGVLSAAASLLHVGIIIGGPDWYRFFGAGEEMATLAEQGSMQPHLITAAIALILMLWSMYAFSGAGLIRRLPLMKVALILISLIYLLRGLALVPIWLMAPGMVDTFVVLSSLICLVYGLSYAVGTKQVWRIL